MADVAVIPKIDHPEQAGLIGGAWMDKALRAQLVATLQPHDFAGHDRTLMGALAGNGDGKFSYLTAESKLTEDSRKRLGAIQGVLAMKPTLREYQGWLKRVEETSINRQMKAALTDITQRIGADTNPVQTVTDVVKTLVKLNTRTIEDMKDIGQSVQSARDMVAAWKKGDKYVNAIPTGFANLDRLLGGLKRGHICVLAARPSRGKTQGAIQIARNVALRILADKRDAVVMVYSAEMTDTEIALRLAQCASGISTTWLREGKDDKGKAITDYQRKQFDDALAELEKLKDVMKIIPAASPTTQRIYQEVAAQHALHKDGVDLVVFDYIELAGNNAGRQQNETNRIGSIMRGLKAVAKDYNCNVLALSQLNRKVEDRSDRWADLEDLRQSGDVEALAEQVLFIDWPGFYYSKVNGFPHMQIAKRHDQYKKGGFNCILYIAKNRGGVTRKGAKFNFTPEITRFEELAS